MTEVGALVDGVQSHDIGGAPADARRYDFFISYAPADKEWAEWIAWQLEERLRLAGRQPKLFFRDWDVVAGTHETGSRHQAIIASERLVAVLTKEYLADSRYSTAEWAPFRNADPEGFQRRVVPVRVKPCQPGGLLGPLRLIDLVDRGAASATDRLLSGINEALEGRARPVIAPAFPEPRFPGPPALVGEPPTVPPKWFRDRNVEIDDIERHLGNAQTGLVMVVGRVGFGKTAMVHRLWERLRTGESSLRVHGLIYLSAHGFSPVTADSVIDGLTALFPKYEAEQLEVMIRQPTHCVEKLVVLLDALAGRRVIIAIDAIEELLDDDEDIAELNLRELIDYLVPRAQRSGVALLLVGRHAARAVAGRFPHATHKRNLDEGLPDRDAFALLQAMDVDGGLNLDAVPDHDRARLHRLTAGSPRALELTYGVLAGGDFSFTRLLEFMARADSEGMVVHLLAHACERLSLQERRVLQALAVYGRPVQPAAVDHLLRNDIPDLDSDVVLKRLRRLRLAQSDGEYFSVPANQEREYLIGLAPAGGTPVTMLRRAADYFVGQRHANPRWLTDLRPHLIEIELRLRAGDYETAFKRMGAVDDGYLLGWGASSALERSLRMLLRADGIPTDLEIDAESMLARVLIQQEYLRQAAEHLMQALGLASGARRARQRIVLREQLAAIYLHLGDLRNAAVHSSRARRAATAQLRRGDTITTLAGVALCRGREGRFAHALRLFAMARWMLKLFGTSADRVYLPGMLLGEAWVHSQLGDRDRAQRLLREGRQRAAELGKRRLEGSCLLSEAQLALDDRELDRAVALAEEASAIGVRNGNRWLCRVAMEILAQARLGQGDLDAAARAADIAQRNRGSVLGFGLVGLAAYRRDKDDDARDAFHQGRTEASKRYRSNERDFQFLEAHGLVACGLALLGEPSYLATALDAYRAAREITTGAGAVRRSLLLLQQFEPRADPRILEQVRAAAKGERRALPRDDEV